MLSVAIKLGSDRNEHWSAFGATNVLIHKALADIQSGGLVVEAARAIPDADPMHLPKKR